MPRFSRFMCSTVLCGLLVVSTPALANIDDSGAQKLKAMMQTVIESQKTTQQAIQGDLITNGDIVVEKAGAYYAITIPATTTIDPEGNRTEMGMIAINTSPGSTDDQWKMSVALPSPIMTYDKEGKTLSKITLNGQRMAGLWDARMNNFTKMDAVYENVTIEEISAGTNISLPKISMKYDLDEKSPGVFNGPFLATIENVLVKDASGSTLGSLKSGSFKMDILDMSMNKSVEFQDAATEYLKQIETNTPDATFAFFSKMVGALGDGFTSQYEIQGLKLSFPENIGTDKPQSLEIAKAGFGMDMTGFATNDVKFGLRMNFDNLKSLPENPNEAPVAPHSVDIDLTMNKLPMAELMGLAQTSAQMASGGEEAKRMAGMQAMFSLPTILSTAGSNLTVNKAVFKNKTSSAEFNGSIIADATAVLKATAVMTGKISGLDGFITSIQKDVETMKAAGQASKFERLLPALIFLKGVGEQSAGPNGDIVSNYKILLDPAGQATINGASIEALTGGAVSTTGTPAAQ